MHVAIGNREGELANAIRRELERVGSSCEKFMRVSEFGDLVEAWEVGFARLRSVAEGTLFCGLSF